jgi:hypothetical protein
MIIDLVDIPGDNPMGRTDMMDSLEFMEGYFIHNRAFDKTNSGLQKRGLTKSNLNKLINAGLASKSAKIPMDFLEVQNLTASYHNYKAAYFLKNNELDKAAEELEKAKVKCGIDCCKTNFLLTDYYSKIKDYEKSLIVQFNQLEEEYQNHFDSIKGLGVRKLFAQTAIMFQHPSILFGMLDGKDISPIIWKIIKPEFKKL